MDIYFNEEEYSEYKYLVRIVHGLGMWFEDAMLSILIKREKPFSDGTYWKDNLWYEDYQNAFNRLQDGKMISVFKGYLLPRFYWGVAWSGRRGKFSLKPVKYLFRIGKLRLHLTAYYKHNNKYKEKALEYLRRYVQIKEEHYNAFITRSCYSKQDGSCVGAPENVNIYLNLGIREFFRAGPSDKAASIGWAPKENKW